MRKLILASGSPRRAELLKSAGFEFEVRAADIDESPLASEAASDYVIRVAREKAQSVASGITGAGAIVLAADTTVVTNSRIMGKPRNGEDAASSKTSPRIRPTGSSLGCARTATAARC